MFILFYIGISLLTVAVIYKIVKIVFKGITYCNIDCDEMSWFFVGCAIIFCPLLYIFILRKRKMIIFTKQLKRKSKKELQEIYKKIYGHTAYQDSIDYKYKKYDYIVRLEFEPDVEKYL